MSPINGANNNHPAFFPINFDDSSKVSNENNNTQPNINSAGEDPDFQIVIKSLLENRINSWCNSLNTSDPNSNPEPLFPLSLLPLIGTQNNTKTLLAILNQLQQSDIVSRYSNQSNEQSLSRYTNLLKQMEGKITNTPEMIHDANSNLAPGINPSRPEIVDYITEQCRELGIPEQLGLATATTESGMTQFNKDGTPCRNSNPSSSDWGIMQINDKAWGNTYDMNRIKSDWKYNVRAGLEILRDCYNAAIKNNEDSKGVNSSDQNLARAAYSGYNSGIATLWRYRTPVDAAPKTTPYAVLDDKGYDLRDIRFWNNYQK